MQPQLSDGSGESEVPIPLQHEDLGFWNVEQYDRGTDRHTDQPTVATLSELNICYCEERCAMHSLSERRLVRLFGERNNVQACKEQSIREAAGAFNLKLNASHLISSERL